MGASRESGDKGAGGLPFLFSEQIVQELATSPFGIVDAGGWEELQPTSHQAIAVTSIQNPIKF